MKHIYNMHRTMLEKNLILAYEGQFTQDITKSVLNMTEKKLETIGEENSIKKKVFNVMVECLQNIARHSSEQEEESQESIFMIGKEEEGYAVMSGNYIANDDVYGLKLKLEHINTLDKDELKILYRDTIKNGSLSDKGGAGLGFIDMARKSGQKLGFEFYPVDNKFSFFTLKSQISRV